ncbi:MAG: TIGR02300 family protein [Sphingomonadaceae bacterium]|nr:TIGR02300 family protein [Sphingomonadaceae bacterium]
MVKPEWGTKRACPKCGTRFYDLGKDDPVICIACQTAWEPEPILKSKQPLPFDAPKKEEVVKEEADTDLGDDIDIDEDEEGPADDDNDIGGDDDLGVAGRDDDEEH